MLEIFLRTNDFNDFSNSKIVECISNITLCLTLEDINHCSREIVSSFLKKTLKRILFTSVFSLKTALTAGTSPTVDQSISPSKDSPIQSILLAETSSMLLMKNRRKLKTLVIKYEKTYATGKCRRVIVLKYNRK
jgi:hypothetical protein